MGRLCRAMDYPADIRIVRDAELSEPNGCPLHAPGLDCRLGQWFFSRLLGMKAIILILNQTQHGSTRLLGFLLFLQKYNPTSGLFTSQAE